MNRCDACDFVYDAVPVAAVAARLRSLPSGYTQALRAADRDRLARARPHPGTWSALEYACHVRDVLRVQRERLLLALQEDRPVFAPMRRDERAIEERYNEQEIEAVLAELAEAAARFAASLEALEEEQWLRVGVYNWPEAAERSMAWLARHTLQEGVHHLDDIDKGLHALRATDLLP